MTQQIRQTVFCCRSTDYHFRKSIGCFVLYSKNEAKRILLDEAMSVIWQLADGKHQRKEIEATLRQQFPPSHQLTKEAFDACFRKMCKQGILETTTKPSQAQAIIKIAFYGFGEAFKPLDNYFVQALQPHYTLCFVHPETEQAHLLFAGEHTTEKERECIAGMKVCKIAFFAQKEQYESHQHLFDFVFTSFLPQQSGNKNTAYLPLQVVDGKGGTIKKTKETISETAKSKTPAINSGRPAQALCRFLETFDLYAGLKEFESAYLTATRPQKLISHSEAPLKKGALTIGMATYDDYDGVYFTIQSIRFHHPEIQDKISFILIDNHPDSPVGSALKNLQHTIPDYRYIPFRDYNSTAVRDLIFREADTEYVLCIDSHILIQSGAITRLIDYLDNKPDCMDLLQGVLVADDMKHHYSRFQAKWFEGMLGNWGVDQQAADAAAAPFEIPMQGLGLFACRKKAWPGFNPRFRGFGGEEGYIHEKFRQQGRKTYCLPFLRWLHRFGRPYGTKYPNLWHNRIRNYYIGFEELGMDPSPVESHFRALLGSAEFETIQKEILLEQQNPCLFFDALFYVYNNDKSIVWPDVQHSFDELGIKDLIRPWPLAKEETTAADYDLARETIEKKALKYGYTSLLILDDRALPGNEFPAHLKSTICKMKTEKWRLWCFFNTAQGKLQSKAFESVKADRHQRPENSFITAHHLSATSAQSPYVSTSSTNTRLSLSAGLPKVSCICITYGRTRMLDESVHSFLIQDYPGEKELIILNDYDELELSGDFPNVTIFNEKERYPTIGAKQNEGIRRASGEVILVWDDDDIHLPHRISWIVQHLKGYSYYKPDKLFMYQASGFSIHSFNAQTAHAIGGYTKSLWEETGGYGEIDSGYDRIFENRVTNAGKHYFRHIQEKDIYYIYRWFANSGYHTSAFGYGKGTEESKAFVKQQGIKGVYEISPQWYCDYKEAMRKTILSEAL